MIQYSDESLESRRYREQSLRIHMKRLKDIKDRGYSIDPSPKRFYSVNRRKNRFKQNEMVRENIVLYEKLTQISERKHNKGDIRGPKSLNISIRKKEADRIIQDNFDFVKRLTEKESIFSVKRLKEEFIIQEKYKSTISRHNLHERLKKITESELRLPPINDSKGNSISRVSEVKKIDLETPKKYDVEDNKSTIIEPSTISKTISQSPAPLKFSSTPSPKSEKLENLSDSTPPSGLPKIPDSSHDLNEDELRPESNHSLEDSKKPDRSANLIESSDPKTENEL